jgi:hypothetical protein
MSDEKEMLDELQRLITEQSRALAGPFNDEEASRCRERATRIAKLLELAKSRPPQRA